MKNRKTPLAASLAVSWLVLVLVGAAFALTPQTPREELTIWAASLPDDAYNPGTGAAGIYTDPTQALGEADELAGGVRVVSLGNALADAADPPLLPTQCEAFLLLAYDEYFTDGPDYDLVVFEAAAGGVEEATWVYVGRDDELWLYAGEAGTGDGEGGGIDLAGAVEPGELFNRVAVCDKPDGITSGSPVGGPDIDAVAALHPVNVADYVVRAETPGVFVNGVAVPPGTDSPPLKTGESNTIELEPGAEAQIQPKCRLTDEEILYGGIMSSLSVGWIIPETADLVGDILDRFAITPDCKPLPTRASGPLMNLELLRGGILVTEPDTLLDLDFSTSLALITNSDPAVYGLRHGEGGEVSTMTAFAAPLTITPVDTSLAPFTLGPAQGVTLTAAGVGLVIDLPQVAIPIIMGD